MASSPGLVGAPWSPAAAARTSLPPVRLPCCLALPITVQAAQCSTAWPGAAWAAGPCTRTATAGRGCLFPAHIAACTPPKPRAPGPCRCHKMWEPQVGACAVRSVDASCLTCRTCCGFVLGTGRPVWPCAAGPGERGRSWPLLAPAPISSPPLPHGPRPASCTAHAAAVSAMCQLRVATAQEGPPALAGWLGPSRQRQPRRAKQQRQKRCGPAGRGPRSDSFTRCSCGRGGSSGRCSSGRRGPALQPASTGSGGNGSAPDLHARRWHLEAGAMPARRVELLAAADGSPFNAACP